MRDVPYTISVLRGKDIARRVKKTPPAQRAALAAWVARGATPIVTPTTTQTAMLFGLSPASVSLVKNATDEDLAALRVGRLSLRALRSKRKQKPNGSAPNIDDVIAFVRQADAGLVQAVINAFADFAAPAQAAE
jgi:hypothetical protein